MLITSETKKKIHYERILLVYFHTHMNKINQVTEKGKNKELLLIKHQQ